MRIFFRLAPLRVIRPVVFCWIPRELNRAADFVSKGAHDYRVAPALFLALDSVLHFTLDLFASESERVKGHQGLVPFASFFQSDSSLGDGRRVPFSSNGTTWVFPPPWSRLPRSQTMQTIRLALRTTTPVLASSSLQSGLQRR